MKSVKWVAPAVVAALGAAAALLMSWPGEPTLLVPRPAHCASGPHAVVLSGPWPRAAMGEFETALSANGCLRLRERRLFWSTRHWRVFELQPDGTERTLLEADFAWPERGSGQMLVLQQPYAPEPMPVEYVERGFTRLTWVSPEGTVERRFNARRRQVTEVRTTPTGVKKRVVTLSDCALGLDDLRLRQLNPDY
jgi:hypothetical protein